MISTVIKSKNFIKIVATLNGSSRVLKVIDIIDKGPSAEQPALGNGPVTMYFHGFKGLVVDFN